MVVLVTDTNCVSILMLTVVINDFGFTWLIHPSGGYLLYTETVA